MDQRREEDQVMVLPGIYPASAMLLGWKRLVLRHTMWREIAFGTPNSHARPKSCSCASSRVEQSLLMTVPGALVYFSSDILFSFFLFLFLRLVYASEGSRSLMGGSDVVYSLTALTRNPTFCCRVVWLSGGLGSLFLSLVFGVLAWLN